MEPTWILTWLSEEFVHLFRLEQTQHIISSDYLHEENGWITYCDLYRHEIHSHAFFLSFFVADAGH